MLKKALNIALAATMAVSLTLAPAMALGVTYTGVNTGLGGKLEIEQLSDEFKAAQADVASVDAKISEIQGRIDELAAQIPVQQARTDKAVRSQYKLQNNPLSVADVLLQANTLGAFLKELDYIAIVANDNVNEMNRLRDLNAQLEDMREEQSHVKADADARLASVNERLEALMAQRSSRQSSGIGTARSQAAAQGGEASVGVAYDGGEQPEDYREAATQDTSALSDGADWHSERDEFIAEWAARIDAYLTGSPLEGQGVNFATSAWKYNVDPRWSPAISNTESSKGAFCIRPHNAWGWGAADADPYGLALEWGSWEEAIDAHVKGLSDGYGYTISMNGAKAYCPNTWQSWYNRTLSEMTKI